MVVFAFLWGKFCAFDFDLMVHYGWSSPQTMCGVYVLLGLLWLIVCALHWRDILRIQFWIGTWELFHRWDREVCCFIYKRSSPSIVPVLYNLSSLQVGWSSWGWWRRRCSWQSSRTSTTLARWTLVNSIVLHLDLTTHSRAICQVNTVLWPD